MRWQAKPTPVWGTMRISRRFIWLPRRVFDQYIWLEWEWVVEKYCGPYMNRHNERWEEIDCFATLEGAENYVEQINQCNAPHRA